MLGGAHAVRAGRRAADVVVVGGGVYGMGLAWLLAQAGTRVLVLEAGRRLGSGASGGLGRRGVRSNGRDTRQLTLMAIAQERWRDWRRALGEPRIFERVGHLHLAESEQDARTAEEMVRRQEAHGIRTTLVAGGLLRDLEPHLADKVMAAVYAADDGASDHDVTTRALARAASRVGARVRRGVSVVGIERTGTRATAVVTAAGGRIPVGDALVLVANAGTADLVTTSLAVRLPLLNVLPQVLVTEPVDPLPARHVIGHVSRRIALKALPGRRVMVTGGWLGRVNPETDRPETIPGQVEGNLAEAVAVFPSLAGARLRHAVADRFESVSSDLLPIVDRVPGTENVLVAAGWSGTGWAPAPAYVELIAAWLLSGSRPELLDPFGIARFG